MLVKELSPLADLEFWLDQRNDGFEEPTTVTTNDHSPREKSPAELEQLRKHREEAAYLNDAILPRLKVFEDALKAKGFTTAEAKVIGPVERADGKPAADQPAMAILSFGHERSGSTTFALSVFCTAARSGEEIVGLKFPGYEQVIAPENVEGIDTILSNGIRVRIVADRARQEQKTRTALKPPTPAPRIR